MKTFSNDVECGDEEFHLLQGTLEYLADIDPTQEWSHRGFKATGLHQQEVNKFQESIKKTLQQKLNDIQPKIQEFFEEAYDLYEELVNKNYSPIRKKFQDAQIYVVSGPPRTGGTYLLKSLMEIRGDDIKQFNHKLMSDKVPKHTQMGSKFGSEVSRQAIFGWIQWFLWASERFNLESFSYIPKKHIGALFQMDLFNEIFGDQINFIITTRDPGEAYQSYVERFFPEDVSNDFDVRLWKSTVIPRTNLDEEQWDALDFSDQFLLYWCACYLEVLNFEHKDRLNVLSFGQDYNQYLQDFAQKQGELYFPEPFEPSNREDLPAFSDHCLKIKEKVEHHWREVFDKPLC